MKHKKGKGFVNDLGKVLGYVLIAGGIATAQPEAVAAGSALTAVSHSGGRCGKKSRHKPKRLRRHR